MQKGHTFRFTLLFDRLTMPLFSYRKIPKISPGLIFFKGPFWEAYFWRGLYSEGLIYGGKFAFLNRLGYSLIVGSKFTVFALFYFVFEGNFPSTSPRGAYIWRGDLKEEFLRYPFAGLIFGGVYFRNFRVCYWSLGRCACGSKYHSQ